VLKRILEVAAFTLFQICLVLSTVSAQQPGKPDKSSKSEKFAIYVVGGDDSSAVAQSLIKKMRDSKPFEPVSKEDVSKAIVLVECMHRDKPEIPFACMYMLHLNGIASKTLVGGGLYISQTADIMSDNLLAAIAQDIVERWEETNKRNLKETLEGCLFLTDAKCNVPAPLQDEMHAKQLTLGQYMVIKSQE
jgi:hypothetical protein